MAVSSSSGSESLRTLCLSCRLTNTTIHCHQLRFIGHFPGENLLPSPTHFSSPTRGRECSRINGTVCCGPDVLPVIELPMSRCWRKLKTRAKMSFPKINHTHAAKIDLDLDLDLQTRQSKRPNTSSVSVWHRSVQQFRIYWRKMPFFVPGVFDLWPWPSNWSERGTNHVFLVNLAQVHSTDPEIFHTQTKRSQTVSKTEPCAVHCMQ